MALTQISTAGVKDDAVTSGKIPANAVGNSELADDAVGVAELSATGTASSSTFLRGDNSWTAVNTDLVSDTSPQLGGALDTNGNNITFGDNDRIVMGDAGTSDSHIRWDGSHLQIASAAQARFSCSGLSVVNLAGTETQFTTTENGAVELYHDNSKKFETTSTGTTVTGNLSCTALLPTGNLELVDSNAGDVGRIRMGAGDDFSLYHNGSHSFIQNGTGSTYLDTTGNFYIRNGVGNSTYMYASANEVALYHTGSKKFETRSDGVTVQSSGSNHGIFVKHSNGNVVAKMQNKGSGDEGYLALYDSGGTGPSIQMDGEHGRIVATSIRLHTNDAANELDDYEEGTFTLTLSKSDGSGETSGGTVNYTKIGRWVNCWGQVTFGDAVNNIAGSHCYMKGWPFSFGAANSNDVPVWIWNNGTQLQGSNVTLASMSGSTSSTTWGLYVHTYNGAPSVTGNHMGNGGRVSLGYSYQA